MSFVLDNSVTMRWAFKNGQPEDQAYAFKVLDSFTEHDAFVPVLWHLEVTNVLLSAERDRRIGEADSLSFLSHLSSLPIRTDHGMPGVAHDRIFLLAREFGLSSYDTAYLELAARSHLPLATLDQDLKKAALKFGVSLYLT